MEAVDAVGLPDDTFAVDLAAGTGKLTRVLERRFARVLAVEPDEAMRARNAGAVAGTAEAIPLEDGAADAVFVGEAFHWFDTEEAVGEIARVLRPGGTLALLWNVALDHLVEDAVWDGPPAGSPKRNRFESGEWRYAFANSVFGPFREASFEHVQTLSCEQLVAYYASISWVAVLPDRERMAKIGRFRAALDRDAYSRRLRTEVHWAERA